MHLQKEFHTMMSDITWREHKYPLNNLGIIHCVDFCSAVVWQHFWITVKYSQLNAHFCQKIDPTIMFWFNLIWALFVSTQVQPKNYLMERKGFFSQLLSLDEYFLLLCFLHYFLLDALLFVLQYVRQIISKSLYSFCCALLCITVLHKRGHTTV